MSEPIYVNHLDPLGRSVPYYMAMVDLAYSGLPGQQEQLWLNPLEDGRYRIACVPFCAYGLAYLDEVSLDSSGVFVSEVVSSCGNKVLRVLVHDTPNVDAHDIRDSIVQASKDMKLGFELFGDRFVAIDIPRDSNVQDLVDSLTRLSNDGHVHFEWGHLRRFVQ